MSGIIDDDFIMSGYGSLKRKRTPETQTAEGTKPAEWPERVLMTVSLVAITVVGE